MNFMLWSSNSAETFSTFPIFMWKHEFSPERIFQAQKKRMTWTYDKVVSLKSKKWQYQQQEYQRWRKINNPRTSKLFCLQHIHTVEWRVILYDDAARAFNFLWLPSLPILRYLSLYIMWWYWRRQRATLLLTFDSLLNWVAIRANR